MCPGGTHAPHHPTKEWIEKISEMHLFDEGWNKLRETIFANQKKLGVIPPDAKLTPWPKDLLKEWDTLTADEKKMFIRQVDVFAAYVAYTDHEIGRVIQAVEDMGKLDNTLIIFISGDNGNSAEGTMIGTPNEVAAVQGVESAGGGPAEGLLRRLGLGPDLSAHGDSLDLGLRHAVLVDQADRLALRRHQAGHGHFLAQGDQGQGRHPLAVPPRHRRRADHSGSDRHSRPKVVDGLEQKPIEGVSMAYTFDKKNANAPSTHKTQYFEVIGDHAIYHDGWIASSKVVEAPWNNSGAAQTDPAGYPWELYDLQQRLDPVQGRRRQIPGEAQGNGGPVLERSGEDTRSCRWMPPSSPASSRRARTSRRAATCSPTRVR